MSLVRKFVLTCSALAPIALSVPAQAALDSGLRGAILDQSDAPALKAHSAKLGVRGLDFAAARGDENSVQYLASASGSGSPSYNITARKIARSMGLNSGIYNGSGVTIGIVDTGIQLNNPQFNNAKGVSRVLPGACFAGFSSTLCSTADNQLGGDDAVWPTVTHGTHVAGIAAGITAGLAYAANILPVRVCDSSTGSCPGDIDGGIVWASQHGANVINLSVGGSSLTSRDISSVQTAVANGSLLVVAAGNAGNSTPAGGFLAGAALYDGVRGSMIVVGALTAANTIASFSQEPSTTCLVQDGNNYCLQNYFVVAPGYQILSSVGGSSLQLLSGTSMATPFVSGVAALIKGQWPYLTMQQVASVILGTTDDLGAPGPDPVYGMGEVDAANALSSTAPTSVVTSGTTIQSVAPSGTTGSTGTTSVSNAGISGALSAGVSNSSFLKNVLVVDKFDRTFNADLTKGVSNEGFDISSFVMLDQLLATSNASGAVASGYQAVSSEGYSPQMGLVTMSGLVNTVTTPAVFADGTTARDVVRGYVSNMAVSASPTEDVSFDMGYKLNLTGRINEYDANSSPAYSGLFLSASAVNSPYASLATGGNYVGTPVKLADGLDVRTGFSWMSPDRSWAGVPASDRLFNYEAQNQSSMFNQRDASAAVMSVSWNFADWGGLGVIASQSDEHNGVLGGMGSGALDLARSANTSAIDTSMRFVLGKDLFATVSYGEGVTHLGMQADGLLDSASGLRSRSYGIAVATRDVLGNDSLGIALTRPMYVYSGAGTVAAATSVDAQGNLTFSQGQIGFAEATPETDLEVGYTKAFMDGRLSLQTDAAYQMDVGGQTGRNAATFITRLRLGL